MEIAIDRLLDLVGNFKCRPLSRLILYAVDLDGEDPIVWIRRAVLADDVQGPSDIQPLSLQANLATRIRDVETFNLRFPGL